MKPREAIFTAYTLSGTKVLVGALDDIRRGVKHFGLGRCVVVNESGEFVAFIDESGSDRSTRIEREIIQALTAAGALHPTDQSDPLAQGEIPLAIHKLAAQRDAGAKVAQAAKALLYLAAIPNDSRERQALTLALQDAQKASLIP